MALTLNETAYIKSVFRSRSNHKRRICKKSTDKHRNVPGWSQLLHSPLSCPRYYSHASNTKIQNPPKGDIGTPYLSSIMDEPLWHAVGGRHQGPASFGATDKLNGNTTTPWGLIHFHLISSESLQSPFFSQSRWNHGAAVMPTDLIIIVGGRHSSTTGEVVKSKWISDYLGQF